MTRPGEKAAPDFIKSNIHCGAGPRAAQCLVLGAKARAVLHGRINVSCADVKAIAMPVLRHRIFTNFTADSEGITADSLVQKLLNVIPDREVRDTVDLGEASRDSSGFGAMEEGLISS